MGQYVIAADAKGYVLQGNRWGGYTPTALYDAPALPQQILALFEEGEGDKPKGAPAELGNLLRSRKKGSRTL